MAKPGVIGFLISTFGLSCPRCRKADLFYYPVLRFKKLYKMKSECDYCGQDFEIEPGFYYGSMFISYIISSFFMLISFGIIKFAFKLDVWTTFGIVMALLVLVYFYVFRISRSLWIHFFVKYNPKAVKKQ
ncbi:MAG TPA: DUF983 domain-containing protein [Saprospiraceae bacterium]|nr:DUF983 domain-containing protein [Saprospiraceae bacterium]MCC6688174.1 DUF983 domain-containing protein [Saprospiraceae bacterium]HMV24379.1 DUF983 domain-containing protein [Saprospiraceae bacterium]HMX83712.1 DUF983 domain-containing protein [Saprospiraceae bacterium]HMX84821.1 DUF983 domain-containing protein [Saprospiraceae bacterium]